MNLICASLLATSISGLLALVVHRSPTWAARIGAAGVITGSILGLAASVPAVFRAGSVDLIITMNVPYGSLHLGLDALSAFFLVPILFVSGIGAIYGLGYLRREPGQSIAGAWFFYNALAASMVLVVLARNAVLFLIGWETMALSSYFLVTHALVSRRGESAAVREAGIVYQIATHLGTAFLLAMFVLLSGASGSMEFSALHANGAAAPAGLLFVFALVGFGAKAGFVPLHVWLPGAHPVAPSHVSAVMSGVMIKTGIYGILRILPMLGVPAYWWGWTLVGIGVTSGVLGILFALAQHNLKRLLAYSSVENIGIIALGLGVGLIGQQAGMPSVAALGYAGALLHVLNHGLFKGLLFLVAGAVDHGSGTLQIDALGGLQKRMPWTAALFLLGAVAIAGLPPLNGFIGEFCIYLGALHGAASGDADLVPVLALVIAGLGLIGALAVACFTKAYGVVFQGTPRSPGAAESQEVSSLMRGAMLALGGACCAVALFGWWLLPQLTLLVGQISGLASAAPLRNAGHTLRLIVLAEGTMLLLVAILAGLRRLLARSREERRESTWGCAFPASTSRMQYTASSYADPLTRLFEPLLKTHENSTAPSGYFPAEVTYTSHTHDQARRLIYAPLYRLVMAVATHLRPFQAGRVQSYILYIAITLFVVLAMTVGR